MTTIAGSYQDAARQAGDSPENRAVHALWATEPAAPVDLESLPEHVRLNAAYDVAACVRLNLPMLTLQERIVLAAALLPEFEISDDHEV
jgi:hypothetical protein